MNTMENGAHFVTYSIPRLRLDPHELNTHFVWHDPCCTVSTEDQHI